MSELFKNYSLKERNSFGLDVSSSYFFESENKEDLIHFFREQKDSQSVIMVLGEGSNTLFTKNFEGIIVHPALKGIKIISENEEQVIVRVQAGENWDEFVEYCVSNNWSGLENLSLIPGSVGSCPVQNIGAYGCEVKDSIISVEGFFTNSGEEKTFLNDECKFEYRNSIFKSQLKKTFLITAVNFELGKIHKFNLSYGPVEKEFRSKPIQDLRSLRQTIIEIRESKLPDPKKYGNAGSFFKNPVISKTDFAILIKKYADIPNYPAGAEEIKIPAAWLIEKSGWKGVREGDTGTFPSQPLVIVNYGNATGRAIIDFANKIALSVKDMFGVELEMEVNIYQ